MARYSKEAIKIMQRTLAASKTCTHPEDQRETLGLGIYCRLCKVRVAFVTKEQADKQITDAIKSMGGFK